jgi:glycosyltransferase involved in cell wall biosynthesis/SAM-dependent methyltransferase
MRLAYFSPLPPSKSGIADYSAELLPHLARGADVSVFVEHVRELRAFQGRKDFRVYDVAHFDEVNARSAFDLCLYQMGNNPFHEYVYDRALAAPGVAVLHEHCLHHLIALKTLDRGDDEGYGDLLFQAYGRSGAQLAAMRTRGVSSEYQQFLAPLNYHVVARSLGVVTHNEYAAANLEGVTLAAGQNDALAPGELPDYFRRPEHRLPGAAPKPPLVEVIPHHLSPKVYELDGWDRNECRLALRLPDDCWIVAAFGYVTEVKRLPVLLAAFRRLLEVVPRALCLIVGEDHERHGVAPVIAEMGLEGRVKITGYTEERDFFRYLKAVDATVNLRFPTAGETSGTLVRALGAGKPVIVSDYAQFSELPGDVCLKAPLGEGEEETIYKHLRRLASQPALSEALGRRAMEWARERCDVRKSAARYLSFAERVLAERGGELGALAAAEAVQSAARRAHSLSLSPPEDAESPMEFDEGEAVDYVSGFFAGNAAAEYYIRHHRERLVETLRLIPRGSGSRRLLEVSSYLHLAALVRRYGRYGEIEVTGYWQGGPETKLQEARHAATGEELRFVMKRLDAERDRFPYPDEHFDVALCCELIEHLAEDPMHMLLELNRVLKWNGLVVVTTPNIASAVSLQESLAGHSPYIYGHYNRVNPADRHHREYTPEDVQVALESAGFKVVSLFTKDVWNRPAPEVLKLLKQSRVPLDLRGDNIFAVGRKMSTRVERYPARLYD